MKFSKKNSISNDINSILIIFVLFFIFFNILIMSKISYGADSDLENLILEKLQQNSNSGNRAINEAKNGANQLLGIDSIAIRDSEFLQSGYKFNNPDQLKSRTEQNAENLAKFLLNPVVATAIPLGGPFDKLVIELGFGKFTPEKVAVGQIPFSEFSASVKRLELDPKFEKILRDVPKSSLVKKSEDLADDNVNSRVGGEKSKIGLDFSKARMIISGDRFRISVNSKEGSGTNLFLDLKLPIFSPEKILKIGLSLPFGGVKKVAESDETMIASKYVGGSEESLSGKTDGSIPEGTVEIKEPVIEKEAIEGVVVPKLVPKIFTKTAEDCIKIADDCGQECNLKNQNDSLAREACYKDCGSSSEINECWAETE